MRFLFLRSLWLVAISGLTFSGCSSAEETAVTPTATVPGESLTVMSWNIEWFPGGEPRAKKGAADLQMAGARQAVAKVMPDILLVQEVRNWQALATLCEAVPGLKPVVISSFPNSHNVPAQNMAIATTLPVNSGWYEAFHRAGAYDPPRGFAFAALELPDRLLLCYSVHLKSNRGDLERNFGTREESARQLLSHIQHMRKLYEKWKPVAVLVAGDFNTSLDDGRFAKDSTLRMLRQGGLHWTYEGVPFRKRISLPSHNYSRYPDTCFDHIFTEGLGEPKAHTLKIPGISDHMPIVMKIALPATAEQR